MRGVELQDIEIESVPAAKRPHILFADAHHYGIDRHHAIGAESGYVFISMAADYTANQHSGLVALRYRWRTVRLHWPGATPMDRRRLAE